MDMSDAKLTHISTSVSHGVFQRRRLRQRYLVANGQDREANRDSLDKVCGDRSFTCPTKELTEMFSRRGIRTYFYYLSYRASTEVWPDWMGVIHGADIQVRHAAAAAALLLKLVMFLRWLRLAESVM